MCIFQPTIPAEGKLPPRIGNIGHTTRISNKLVQVGNNNSDIQAYLQVFPDLNHGIGSFNVYNNTVYNSLLKDLSFKSLCDHIPQGVYCQYHTASDGFQT